MVNKKAQWAFFITTIGILLDLFVHVEIITYIAEIAIVAGFIIGILALKQIRVTGERGKGYAIFSIVIGILGILIIGGALIVVALYGKPA